MKALAGPNLLSQDRSSGSPDCPTWDEWQEPTNPGLVSLAEATRYQQIRGVSRQ